MSALLKVSRTAIAEITTINGTAGGQPHVHLLLTNPPLIGDDPIAYVPGQQIFLDDARRLYEALRAVYEPARSET